MPRLGRLAVLLGHNEHLGPRALGRLPAAVIAAVFVLSTVLVSVAAPLALARVAALALALALPLRLGFALGYGRRGRLLARGRQSRH